MRFSCAVVAAAVLAFASASPSPIRNVIHEKRDVIPSQWMKRSRLSADLTLPVRVGLKQRNIEEGERVQVPSTLLDVSDPQSPNYGNHWTPKQVQEFFSPSDETVKTVLEWLHAAGIDSSRVRHSSSKGWLEFEAPTSEVESLLNTEYYVYDHESQDRNHVACQEYSVPAHVSPHLDFITPTVHFDTKPEKPTDHKLRKRGVERRAAGGMFYGPKFGSPVNFDSDAAANDLSACQYTITPACLRALYKLPKAGTTGNVSSFGIVEYAPETYLQKDLNNFWLTPVLNDAGVPSGTAPKLVRIDGGDLLPNSDQAFGINGEPDLDLEYGMALVYPQTVTLYQVGDTTGKEADDVSFNNFLDAIDGSYCVYEGGDNHKYDEMFPDPGGYEKPQQCGTAPLTAVISTSYAYNEHDLSPSYEQRQCNEYMKLGLMGTSILYSSGDYGVAGNGGQCIAKNGSYTDGTTGHFNPSFPGTCPYITSVGATQLPQSGTITSPETASETIIYSGGGFSNVFATPSYQKEAVLSYYQNHAPPYGAGRYNNSEMVRGFPDVSANGANYLIALDGDYVLVYGTSASTPMFASVVTLINEKRVAAGMKTLGFLNPAFYANPGMFNDIVSGGNQGCGTPGFTAVPGWDPVTGLGTPNYEKMIAVLG